MSQSGETKICPWCGEEIKASALLCRFCHSDVTPRGMEAAQAFAAGQAPPPPAPPAGGPAPSPAASHSVDPSYERLRKFVPKTLLSGLVETAEAINEGERRPISVLFSDLCGFTTLTERIGAEAMSDLLDVIYATTRRIVAKYDGQVDKFIGDAVMALFGAPRAHGDDPERAIRAALEIRAAIRSIGEASGFALDTHSGIAFGEVVYKSVEEGGRLDFRTIGDAVNLASRLQGLARDGETLVDHRIYLQTRTIFDWDRLDPVEIKGKRRPIEVHRVAGARKVFSKVALGERIDMAPLVGRDREMEALAAAYSQASRGAAAAALIKADAGVGKSRLVFEFSKTLAEGSYRWYAGYCLSYGRNIPFLPIMELVRSIFRWPRNSELPQSPEDLRQGVEHVVASAGRGRSAAGGSGLDYKRERAIHALAFLFSIDIEANPLLLLDPRQRRDRIFECVAELIRCASLDKPAVLVFEDMHWADEDSLNLVDHLLDALRDRPVLFLILSRPEIDYVFRRQDEFAVLELKELSDRDSEALLRQLLGIQDVPLGLWQKIARRTEGNPFYIEEVVLDLEERGALRRRAGGGFELRVSVESIEIPDTVESVVLSRLDRLERSIKRVLQCASVVGQEFRYTTLEHIEAVNEQLRAHLNVLVSGDYVDEHTLIPELAYIFRHIVLRDVAYSTLLERRRRYFHTRIGDAIEIVFAGRLDEVYEILAHHYELGEDIGKALLYLEQAALKCEALYANRSAANHWERLLIKIAESKRGDRATLELTVRANLHLGELCRRLGWPERGIEACADARKLAGALQDERAAVSSLRLESELQRLAGASAAGLRLLRQALERARAANDENLIVSCLNYLGHFERNLGHPAAARSAFEEVLAYAEKTGDRQRRYQALNHLGILLMAEGKAAEAGERFETALALARELGRKNEVVQIQLNLGVLSVRMGLCARGVERLRQAQAEAEQLEFERGVQLALTAQIDAALKMGDFRGAARLSRRLFRRFGDARFADVRAVALTNRARAYLADGETDRAAADIQQAMRLLDGGENYIGLIDALFVRSEIELARNEPRQALESARSAIREIQSSREPEFMAAARILLARCQMALGEIEEARKTLASALKAARQANLPREEGWALLAQGQIAIAREERPKAQKLLREALALAERSEDEALRAAALDALDSVS